MVGHGGEKESRKSTAALVSGLGRKQRAIAFFIQHNLYIQNLNPKVQEGKPDYISAL